MLAMALFITLGIASACGDKKDPLVPDNPNADPMMMDGGAVDPAAASSAAPK